MNLNFLIGFPRTGSTWLYYNLVSNNVFVPEIKEIKFFDKNYKKGIDWYLEQFKGNKDCFDLSITYSLRKEALILLKKHFPQSKIILFIREPKERDISACTYRYANGLIELDEIKNLILSPKKNIENLNTNELWGTAGKYYSDHIKNIYEIFDTDQIVFYHYDDIKNNPEGLLRSIFKECGIKKKLTNFKFVKSKINQRRKKRINPLFTKLIHGPIAQTFKKLPFYGKLREIYREIFAEKGNLDLKFNYDENEKIAEIYSNEIKFISNLNYKKP
tara:strand:+ start:301 stop:1122 length:822 start_codon:yes stop_codon:yes gene_type:complete